MKVMLHFSRRLCFFPLSLVQSLSHVQLFETPWTIARQASLSITNYRSLFKLMSINSQRTQIKHKIKDRKSQYHRDLKKNQKRML